ncbi:hypothetical protein LINPERHAP2_LOCUS4060 [Linum perenne]
MGLSSFRQFRNRVFFPSTSLQQSCNQESLSLLRSWLVAIKHLRGLHSPRWNFLRNFKLPHYGLGFKGSGCH